MEEKQLTPAGMNEEDPFDDDYYNNVMGHFLHRARNDLSNMDDIDYHDIEDYNKRLFFKLVDLWIADVGPTKKGHREFLQVAMNSLEKFKIESDIGAYLKLLDCYPEGKHTGR